MKKNKMMRLASVLLVAVLLSTCAISGTFAKYVTSASGSDSARVAKWGVTITATSDTGFDKIYKDTALESDDGTATVVASVNVVAPGTNGTLTDVALTGSPEVAVKVSYAAELTLSNWTVPAPTEDNANATEEYCPIVITVENTEYTCTGTVAEFKAAVEAAIAACTKEYAAGTDLSTIGADAPSVSWSWDFDANGAGTNDVKDTALGNIAANDEITDKPTISLKITTTVTQID